jgi:rSAM/selenodomain-associated transferase 2
LNAADTLGETLAALRGEIIVVDGGSTDETIAIATRAGARVIRSPRGRGRQLAAGAQVADTAWLLFVHADTVLDGGWHAAALRFIGDPANAEQAAVFTYALRDRSSAARRLEKIVAWRTRRLGLPYGDQGLLISRAAYDAVGGYRDLPLMEDVDLMRRLGRRRIAVLDCRAVTSAARYRSGYIARSCRNLCCLALYFAGVSPRFIAKLYG